jgi:malate synthase
VPIYNLMEDAATAEICRAQAWQWVRHQAQMKDGPVVTASLVRENLQKQADKLRGTYPENNLVQACRLYDEMITGAEFPDFLTLRAYEYLD